jgi:hypothetical protein
MCELCNDDVVTLATEQTATVRIADGQPLPLSVLGQEATSMIFDIERHLDTERDEFARRSLCDTIWALRWARENIVTMLNPEHVWQSQPSTNNLLARYPHPDDQPK